jgi:hypothetical protein
MSAESPRELKAYPHANPLTISTGVTSLARQEIHLAREFERSGTFTFGFHSIVEDAENELV